MRNLMWKHSSSLHRVLFTSINEAKYKELQRFLSIPSRRTLSIQTTNGYVDETIVPMYHFQKSLYRLPIPKLNDTCTRYLNSIEAIATRNEFIEMKAAIETFQQTNGIKLHEALIARDKANEHTSYINEWWLDMYLKSRDALPINYNPQVKLKDDPNKDKNTQLQRATSLIASTVRVYRSIRDEKLQPDIYHLNPQLTKTRKFQYFWSFLPESISLYGAAAFKAYPLDMSQYKNLFASTRIPEIGKDKLQIYPNPQHIVVQRGNQFFRINVLNENGDSLSDSAIYTQLKAILDLPLSADNPEYVGPGCFTTMSRDEWANARKSLEIEDPMNKKTLDTIDSALFMVTLEHTAPVSRAATSRTFLLGDGENHWFDKSFQLIISENGTGSVNFEHAWGDGVAVLRYINEMYADSIKYGPITTSSTNNANIQELHWNLSSSLKLILQEAKAKYEELSDNLFIECAETPVQRSIGKKYNIGTDGVMQLAIQLAHYRLHGTFVATYESASTAAFKHGRTETVRSCTKEAVAFVKAMLDDQSRNSKGKYSKSDLAVHLRAAVAKHNELTKNGVMGQGFDRHLFALRKMAEIMHEPVPDFYLLPLYERFNRIILSTSTLSSPSLDGGSFGPVNSDCYGIGYGIEAEGSLFQLASYRSDLSDMRDLLVQSLLDIEQLLASTSTTK